MFFFFVGGVEQQVKQVLKSGAGRCIACGSRADLVDYDNVIKAFFVPVWRWPGKDPLMYCNDCKLFFPPPPLASSIPETTRLPDDAVRCRFCDRAVEADFSFCPFCGSAIY